MLIGYGGQNPLQQIYVPVQHPHVDAGIVAGAANAQQVQYVETDTRLTKSLPPAGTYFPGDTTFATKTIPLANLDQVQQHQRRGPRVRRRDHQLLRPREPGICTAETLTSPRRDRSRSSAALAAAAHLPGAVTVPLGVGLFFAPGYLWSEAILSQRLSGLERAMTSAGLALIFPILGGFLFYALRIPLLKPAWIGLLVVLTLLGVVAVAIQRLREAPVDRRAEHQRRSAQQAAAAAGPKSGLSALHAFIFGLAAVIGLGSVAFSVKNAEAQKFPPSALSMTDRARRAVLRGQLGEPTRPTRRRPRRPRRKRTSTLRITRASPEQYELKLLTKGQAHHYVELHAQ